jgi:hypothetical protein
MEYAPTMIWQRWALLGLPLMALPAVLFGAESGAMLPGSTMPAMEQTMVGMDGPYPMAREASGTSWQPDSTPLGGYQRMDGRWMTMWGGFANLIDDDQAGPRGGSMVFSNSVLMFMTRRELDAGACGVHLMLSADPLMGKSGYPELFQTGETADGVHPLIDRQHPHNLLMEAAGSCSVDLGADRAAYLYAGLAGEPALGPPAFMHRFSGIDDPEAPLSHHWLDSTHVTYGVVTAGYVWDRMKLEASSFNGREPDQNRYDVELRGLDSYAARLSYNPLPDLALQISTGRLASPEQLEPAVSVHRTTASASFNRLFATVESQTTAAFGRNVPDGGIASDAWLLESAWIVEHVHTAFLRAERVAKDELFMPGEPLYGRTFTVDSMSLGYIYDFAQLGAARLGVGGMLSLYRYPAPLDAAYGKDPVSYLLFLRVRL